MLREMVAFILARSDEFTTALIQHLNLTFIALGISVALGLGLGIISTRVGWLRRSLLAVAKLGRTIPSLAVLALALPLLGIGTPPALLALTFIGTLPVLINTVVGIQQIAPEIKEAARGQGLRDYQVLLRLELPLALPVIMAGIRTAAVIIVASATLAGFIGGGGLGDLILRGHALNQDAILLAGALPATFLALYFEETFGRLEQWVTPRGLRPETGPRQGWLAVVLAIALLPLVLGVLLPWTVNGELIRTGLHAPYCGFTLPSLGLGLVAVLWPPRTGGGLRLVPWGLSLLALVGFGLGWLTVGERVVSLGVALFGNSLLAIALGTTLAEWRRSTRRAPDPAFQNLAPKR